MVVPSKDLSAKLKTSRSWLKRRLLGSILCGLLYAVLVTSCSRVENIDPKLYYERVLNLSSLPERIEDPADQINLLCWNDYFPEALFEVFEAIYGTKVNVEYFENNEELRRKYEASPEKWDLLMPSDYMVDQFIKSGYLHKFDRSKLPVMEQLHPIMFELDCDPGLRYFLPVFHSCLGLSFEVQHMSGFPRHWDYWDQHQDNPYIYGRVAMPNQMRVTLAMALLRLGFDPNTTNPDEITEAADYLISYIETYGAKIVGDEIADPEFLKDFLLVLTWNGTGAYLLSENSNYRFLIPEDQTIFAVDGFVISNTTKKLETCYLFLNYVLTPEVLALLSNYSFYAPASSLAERHVNSFITNGPSILIPKSPNRISLRDVGEAEAYYQEAWERVIKAKPRDDLTEIPLQNY